MLNKIFNRKYLKAIKEIEEQIEILKGREQYYHNELRLGADYHDTKVTIAKLEYYHHQRICLENTLQNIKTQLH